MSAQSQIDHETFPVPTTVEGITAAWLTHALSRAYPGTVVTHVTQGAIVSGGATKVRLLLEYNWAGHRHRLPPSLWFKGGLEAHSQTAPVIEGNASEVGFYTELAPALSLDAPQVLVAFRDPVSGASAMLMEDLLARNVQFGHATRPLSPDQLAHVLDQLAGLHRTFWERDVSIFSFLSPGGSLVSGGILDAMYEDENWDWCRWRNRGAGLVGLFDDKEELARRVMTLMLHDAEHANTIVHGDPHPGNLYFAPGRGPALYDWQTVMHGYWAHDVAYALMTGLSVKDRRACERELVDYYITALAASGIKLERAGAFDDVTRHYLFGVGWALCRPEWHADDVSDAFAERTLAAIRDHNSYNCW